MSLAIVPVAVTRVPAPGLRLERVRGIEPPFKAWEALVLPLNYTRPAIQESAQWSTFMGIRYRFAGGKVCAISGGLCGAHLEHNGDLIQMYNDVVGKLPLCVFEENQALTFLGNRLRLYRANKTIFD